MLGLRISVLTKDELQEIHEGALKILERVGVSIFEPEAVRLLGDCGAKVDGTRVYIPASLVEEAVSKAPDSFMIYARNEKHNVEMRSENVYFEPMIGRINVIDWETGERRRTSIRDVENLIKLADALDNYHILHSGAVMPRIEGVPEGTSHAHGYFASVRNSSKIIKGSARGKEVADDCIEMASILAGTKKENLYQRPNIFTTCNVISPLKHDKAQTQGLLTYSKYGLPVDITSEPQLGATSPITLAGALIQQTAEILSGIVIAQLVNPGTPVWFGTCAAAMDMRSGIIALGGVEGALMNIAHAQLAKYYRIPSRGTGCNTESKILDMQAGYEKAITLLLTALAGNNMIFYPGTIEHALTIDYRSLVIDNEICGMVSRILKGIEVNEETKALGLIQEVALGGHFLGKKHTLDHLNQELFLPRLSDRDTIEEWKAKGAKDVSKKATEKVREILEQHKVDPLEREVGKKLREYVVEVENREATRRG